MSLKNLKLKVVEKLHEQFSIMYSSRRPLIESLSSSPTAGTLLAIYIKNVLKMDHLVNIRNSSGIVRNGKLVQINNAPLKVPRVLPLLKQLLIQLEEHSVK